MNSQNPGYKSRKTKKQKRAGKGSAEAIILCFLTFVIGITALCFIVMKIVQKDNQPVTNSGNTIIFYEADYDRNIFEDESYLELDRNVRFENTHNGLTIEIVDDNLNDVPTDIRDSFSVIYNFVNYAINGDYESLNALFSDEYIEAGGEIKMAFTMQELYNIKISYINDATTETGGYSYSSQDFWLEYMIRKNNGTFRNDMASDCIKKEYIRVTNRDNTYEIDVLAQFNTSPAETQKMASSTIISIAVITVLMVVAMTTICIVVTKKIW